MNKRIVSIDILRVVSIFAVLAIHTTTRTLETVKFDLLGFPFAIVINQVARFAVPLFIIISGFVLELNFDNKLSILDFFKKRFSKILIPYIFWSLIYYFFIYNQNKENILTVLFKGDASYQLYFIPTLCIFYLVFPLLHRLTKYLFNIYTVIILGLLECWLLYSDYSIHQFRFAEPVRVLILSWFFFLFGIFIAKNKEKLINIAIKYKKILFFLTLVFAAYVSWQGVHDYLIDGSYLNFYSAWRPSVLIYTIILFTFIIGNFNKENRYIKIISDLSFLVFFVHVIILEIVWMYFGKSLFNFIGQTVVGKAVFDPLFFAMVCTISFAVAHLFHKIPKLHKLTG